jgi:stress-induced morphogen
MASNPKRSPDEQEVIRTALAKVFPADSIKVYRYNSASLRVRIIDRRFEGKSIVEREAVVLPIIESLPDAIQQQITVLLLLGPGETRQSLMNVEFENPSTSRL